MARRDARDIVTWYNEAKTIRNPHENDWRMASAYCMPRHYGAWMTDGAASYGGNSSNARRVSYDSTGARSLAKYVAILERLATPHNMKWHGFTVTDKSLMRKARVRDFLDTTQSKLFTMRYAPRANFKRAFSEVYGSLGTYGMGPIYVGQRRPNALSQTPGFLYKACPLRDIFILTNDDGEVVTVFRRFFLNVRQFREKFPGAELPRSMAAQTQGGATPKETSYYEFIHVCTVREDFDRQALDSRRHPISGSYVCVPDQCYVADEHGYRSMPYLTPRVMSESGDPYGYAPAIQALPALGSASAIKKTNLRQGQKAADPVLLAHDDGMINGGVDLRPGAVNYGAVDRQGRALIQTLQTGNFQVSKDILQDERRDIEDSFFVTLFQILTETPEMTATEVMERVAEKSALLSPTMGALQSELLGPDIERELDLLDEMGQMPRMPPELIEAKGEYEIIYTSPMAKGIYAEEVSGFMRAVEMALQVVNATGDNSHLDNFNFDTAIPEISDYMAVPARWMNDENRKAELADNRATQAQDEMLVKNAAPIAGALKTAKDMQQGTE
jgi:hypothetical protein